MPADGTWDSAFKVLMCTVGRTTDQLFADCHSCLVAVAIFQAKNTFWLTQSTRTSLGDSSIWTCVDAISSLPDSFYSAIYCIPVKKSLAASYLFNNVKILMWLLREILNFGCVQRVLLTQEGVGESSAAVKHRSCERVPRSAGHFILIRQIVCYPHICITVWLSTLLL
jgi:hypothetical protein